MTNTEIKEAVEILKTIQDDFTIEIDKHSGTSKNVYNTPAVFSFEKNYKKSFDLLLLLATQVLEAKVPIPKVGVKNKGATVKCKSPEDCSFPNCDCNELEITNGVYMPLYSQGYNQALHDFRLYQQKCLGELEEVIYTELKRQYKNRRLPINIRIKDLVHSIRNLFIQAEEEK